MPKTAAKRPPPALIKAIQNAPDGKIKIAVTDIDGVLRGKYISKDKFLSSLQSGLGFCNVVFGWDCADLCYDNGKYTGWHTGYPDAQVKIDPHSLRKIPWENETPFFLADFVNNRGEPLEVCPRGLLKRILDKSPYVAKFGVEYEWFNFQETPQTLSEKKFQNLKPLTPGMFGYSILRSSLYEPYFSSLFRDLTAFGVPIEGLHTETGPGVYEACILYSDPLEAADRGVLFKTGVKEIAYRHQILPTFMAKWNRTLPGCGGHLHQSLWNKAGSINLFSDAKGAMSPLFKSYLAGQLHCIPEILPFFAPNVNSYKRLVEGAWAPTRLTWGMDNRTAALRVITGGKSTRLETRVGGADFNPYLAIAAALGSGLYGIEKGLTLRDAPVVGNAYREEKAKQLPRSLLEATEHLGRSKIAREIFGDSFVDHFVQTRLWEWKQFQDSVTGWELERYFEII